VRRPVKRIRAFLGEYLPLRWAAKRLVGRARIRLRWRMRHLRERFQSRPASLACPLCSHTSSYGSFRQLLARCEFGGGEIVRHQCPNCDVIFGPRAMLDLSPDQLAAEYAEHYRYYEESDSLESELRTFKTLDPRPEGTYLNFGCGKWSQTVIAAQAMGYRLLGFDEHVHGEALYMVPSTRALAEMQFDGIMSHNVLEHLRHPVMTLKFLTSVLQPDGYMVHRTPCYAYLYEWTRFHLFFFVGRSLGMLSELAGLTYKLTADPNTVVFRPPALSQAHHGEAEAHSRFPESAKTPSLHGIKQ
jgi:2-polyprenyl-3-methyl-5-hydroxy-6-metoxy-1,4-benzoquinol methylase